MSSAPSSATTAAGTIEEQLATLLALPENDNNNSNPDNNHFSVATYLNLALDDSSHNEEQLQQRMAELALQLQFQTQACHEDIGRIGAELQAVLPRCHADVGRIGVGLQGLQQDAATLLHVTSLSSRSSTTATKSPSAGESKEAPQEEASVSSSLETLSTLHALQANLKRTHEILTAAATWDNTLAEIPPLLAPPPQDTTKGSSSNMASNLPQAVQKLALLEQGEKALRGMPHPEERTAALQKFRSQMSHLLAPQLQHALQHMSSRLGPLQQCVALYAQLHMTDALVQTYVASRPTALHKAWFDFTTSQQQENFEDWWPTWLESVLGLLQEERRQAAAVFGVGHVPTLLALVLEETFRPVLPSLTSRLGQTKNLDQVCHVYKSLLQFLAVAYEAIAAGWLDWMETTGGNVSEEEMSSSKTLQDGPSLYRQVMSLFQKIVSPFATHQTTLTTLETTYFQEDFTNYFTQRVQEVMSSNGPMELDDLTRATEGLWHVSQHHLVSTAQTALERFEFLQGGYGAVATLDAVDHATSQRVQHLDTSLASLNQAMDWATVFDEPHVLAALQVLKVAATAQSLVQQLQDHAQQRFGVLADRIHTALAQETEVNDASFLLPDALSPVDLNALLCRTVFGSSETPEAALAVLQRLSGGTSLLGQTTAAVTQLCTTCHQLVFSACVAVPQKHLQPMAAMACWKASSTDSDEPSYGTLPQSYITLVGEHMLALVQALEPFGSDAQNLQLANSVMDGLTQIAQSSWQDVLAATGVSNSSQDLISQLMDSKHMAEYVLGEDGVVDEDEEEDDDNDDAQDTAVVKFCNAWLDVVGLAVTGRLLERILHIPRLTAKGCEHLTADLGYLQNVLVALGVSGHPHPLLGHVCQIVALDLPVLQERIRTADKGSTVQAALVAMEERLAAMKSLSSY